MTFASNLTVGDFLCVRRNGYRPLGQVMGACVYQIGYRARAYTGATGWPGYPDAGYFELGAPTRAWNEARATALEDVRRQARDLGADAVVGLQIRSRLRGGPVGTVEIVAVGTGVATDDGDASAPVLSTLDGGELDLLRRNGFTPAGILAATSVTQVFCGYRTSYEFTGSRRWVNRELLDLSRAPLAARRNVLSHLAKQRRGMRADGLLGVRYVQEIERPEHAPLNLVVTVHVVGSAVVRSHSQSAGRRPELVLTLDQETV